MRSTAESSDAAARRAAGTRRRWQSGGALVAGWCLLWIAAMGIAAPQNPGDSPYLITTWQTEDGLPENSATAMAQTPDGYLWFGTFNGLVRFDGARFTVFDRGNVPEMPASGVVNVHVDRRGRLWASTLGGIVLREGGRWRQVYKSTATDLDFVRTFSERPNGDLLLTYFNGKVFEFINDRLTQLPPPPGEPDSGYFGGCDEDGRWWVVQRGFIGTWSGTGWVPALWGTNVPVTKQWPLGFAHARDGGFWFLLHTNLYKYSRGRQISVQQVPDANDGGIGSVSTMSEDSQGNVWIASFDAGVTQVRSNGQTRNWSETSGIAYKDVRFVFEDKEQNLWVGTSGGGLQRFKPRRFEAFGYSQGAAARVVYSVAAGPGGGTWTTTFGQGLFRWDPEGGFRRSKPPGWASGNLHFTSVLTDRQGRTWVGVYADGLLAFGPNHERHFTAGEIGGPTVSALFEDSHGRIWIAAGKGVAAFAGDRFRLYDQPDGLPPGTVCALAEDRDGIVWLSNLQGVFRLVNDRFDPVTAAEGRPFSEVVALKAGDQQTMWMGTSDRGLLRWRAGGAQAIDAQAGLPVRSIHGILEDRRGFFWMASQQGIVRAHRSDLEAVADGRAPRLACQLLDTSDGLPSVECPGQRQPVCASDERGRFWFATRKGVAVTDPARFQVNATPPLVQIESVSFVPAPEGRGRRMEPRHLTAPLPEPLDLPAGSAEIEIHYTALSFAAPEKMVFQVRTEGQDDDWRDRGSGRMERLHSLPPRRYVFHVRAANNDGVWNENGASLAFNVLPYYWQTTWFRFGSASLLIALGGVLAWWWSRRKVLLAAERERAAVERHRSELETRQLREELAHSSRVSTMGQLASALAHELSQPLSAILRNAEAAELVLRHEPPDLAEINAIIADIRKDDQRAAAVIDRMRALLKKRNLELVDLRISDLLDDVAALARPDALQRKVQWSMDVPPDLPLVRGDRIQLQQVLLNLLLNGMDAMADLPAGARRLTLRVSQVDGKMIQIAVQDSGPGLAAQDHSRLFEPFFTTKPRGLGLGLPISRTIVEAHGGRLWAENDPAGGAVFLFTLPIASGGPTP